MGGQGWCANTQWAPTVRTLWPLAEATLFYCLSRQKGSHPRRLCCHLTPLYDFQTEQCD